MDDPSKNPSAKFSASEYRKRKAEREAKLPPSERGQSGLLKVAEKLARDRQMVSNVFKQTTERRPFQQQKPSIKPTTSGDKTSRAVVLGAASLMLSIAILLLDKKHFFDSFPN